MQQDRKNIAKDHSCESESLEESAADILAKLHYAEENSGKDPKGQSAIKGNIENSFEKQTGSEKNVNDVFWRAYRFKRERRRSSFQEAV